MYHQREVCFNSYNFDVCSFTQLAVFLLNLIKILFKEHLFDTF